MIPTDADRRFAALLALPALAPVLAALPRARLVGGAVRDTLAGLPVADIDITTPDPPEQALAALEAAGLRVIPTGLAHGTLTALSQGQPFEVTTLRRDEETDGRHARVAWTDDFQEDAARRDFTINAMSLDQRGALHDYFDGAADLATGRVRFVGEAARRVAEDHLRILRFFRFFARYGSGAPDAEAKAAIADAIPSLARLSAERVWSEIKRILAAPAPLEAVRLMHALGVLHAAMPEAGDLGRLAGLLAVGAPADPLLRLAALLDGDTDALADRLRLSTAERATLAGWAGAPVPQPGDADADLRRALADTPAETLVGRTWLAQADTPGAPARWQEVRARLAAMPRPIFPLEGRHLLAHGAAPGPKVGEILREIRGWWMQGGCVANEAACLAYLARVMPRSSNK
jgi:tRNA nucleotidyltransferase/poly(A) polymerase